MSGDDNFIPVMKRVRAALDARTAGISVSPPPFDAIFARAQGQPPAPPTAAPLPLPSVLTGPGGAASGSAGVVSPGAAASPAVSAVAAPVPTTGSHRASAPASVSQNVGGSAQASSGGLGGRSATASESRAPRRLFKRVLAMGAVGALAAVGVIGYFAVTGDDPCAAAGSFSAADDEVGAECRDLDADSRSLLSALNAGDETTARNFVADRCHDKIPEAILALRGDAGVVSVSNVVSVRSVGTVTIRVEGSPVPIPTPWEFSNGTWKLQLCSALRFLPN